MCKQGFFEIKNYNLPTPKITFKEVPNPKRLAYTENGLFVIGVRLGGSLVTALFTPPPPIRRKPPNHHEQQNSTQEHSIQEHFSAAPLLRILRPVQLKAEGALRGPFLNSARTLLWRRFYSRRAPSGQRHTKESEARAPACSRQGNWVLGMSRNCEVGIRLASSDRSFHLMRAMQSCSWLV